MKVNKLENVDFDKIILLGIEEVYGFDRSTGELAFAFDQVKSGELSGANDVSYAEGKRGVRLATLKSNKTSSFSCENGYVIFSGLARQLGSNVQLGTGEAKITVTRVEALASKTHVLTLSGTPKTVAEASTLKVYSTNADQTQKKLLTDTTDYNASGTTVTLAGTYESTEDGTVFLCTYDEEVEVAKRIVNDGETFSEDVRLVINMLGQDICSGVQYMVQCIMPKASVSGEWNLALGTDPAVHNFNAEASLDVCSIDSELCEFIVC